MTSVQRNPRRDVQRQKVYAAEDRFADLLDKSLDNNSAVFLAGSTLVLPPEAKFSTPATVQAYVDRVLSHRGVVARFGGSKVSVRQRKGVTKAHYHRGVIAVPDVKVYLRETVVLHELAHHFSRDSQPAHGPQFTDTLLELVGAVMGVQAQLALRILYGDNEVLMGTHEEQQS